MIQFEPETDMDGGLKLIHLAYSYSSSELPIDEDIVRRIRFDWDPVFVPVIKVEVWQYPTGGTRKFVHFGFGSEHAPGIPILDPEVYSAPKPRFGYLAEIGRAAFVSPWAQGPPFLPLSPDATPGDTVPFDEKVYNHAKDCYIEMKRRVERAEKLRGSGDTDENTIPGVNDEIRQMAYRAVTTSREERKERAKKEKDAEFERVKYVLKEDKAVHRSFLDLTDDDRALMADFWRRDGDRKNSVHFNVGIPAVPAKPGGIIVVPA